jgi:hypothetical protein
MFLPLFLPFSNPLKSPEPPTYDPDITDYILHKYLLPAAENWSNRRIRAYLDRYDNLNAVLRKDAEAGKIRLSRGI